MNLRHWRAIVRKEFCHILRDPATLLLVTIGPVLLMVIFAYTLTADVTDVPVAVVDEAGNAASQELIERLDAESVITITEMLPDRAAIDPHIERSRAVAVVVIPAEYGEINLAQLAMMVSQNQVPPQIEIVVDGLEPISAEAVLQKAFVVAEEHGREIIGALAEGTIFAPQIERFLELPIQVNEEILYNPDLRMVIDFYPGLAAMMLTLPAIALALSLARENESGTLESLVATPIDKRALLIGKMTPYIVFSMIVVYVLLAMGIYIYDVPFRGNLLEYSLVAFLFVFANLGLGMLISVFIRSQQLAMIIAFLVFFVPPFFLSGLFFPVEAMPSLIRLEMLAFPATHYVAMSKPIFLQGTSIWQMLLPLGLLFVICIAMLEVATFFFRKKVILTLPFKLGRKQRESQTGYDPVMHEQRPAERS